MPASSFADVVSDRSGLAPDNAQDRTPVIPQEETPETTEQPPVKETETPVDTPKKEPEEKPRQEPPQEEPKETPKETPEETELNPHLAPKKDEPKEDPESDDIPEDQLKGMTKEAKEKARETWGTLKKSIKERDAKIQERETELETLRKTVEESAKTGPEIEKLRQELESARTRLQEYEGELAVGRIEATREFKERVKGPMGEAEATVKELSEKYEIPQTTLMAAIREPDPKRRMDALEDISVDFKNLDRIELSSAAKTYKKALDTAEELRSSASERLAEMETVSKQQAEQNAAAISQEFRDSAESAFKTVQNEIPLLQSVPGNQKWNEYLEALKAEATAIDVNKIPVPDLASMAVKARALPEVVRYVDHYRNRAEKAEQEAKALNARLAEFRSTEPGAGGGAREENTQQAKSTSFVDSIFPDR